MNGDLLGKIMNKYDYGVIGGVNPHENLEPNKAKLNDQNEWEQAIRQYLLSGMLKGGKPAIKNKKTEDKPKQISLKQRAAIRR